MADWQPIETIPPADDGEAPPVVLFNPRLRDDPDFPGLSITCSNPVYAFQRAKVDGYTHWLQLPATPN